VESPESSWERDSSATDPASSGGVEAAGSQARARPSKGTRSRERLEEKNMEHHTFRVKPL
jgi:hypothetical protein